MKSFIYTLILLTLPVLLLAQVQVETITDEIKGSGGLSLDNEGNLYIGDFGDFLNAGDNDSQLNNIMKLDLEGNLSVYASGFARASGNAFNSEGVLYQADIGTSQIFKIVNGTKVFVSSLGIIGPVGLAFDSEDNLYVCNCNGHNIRKITPSGSSTIFSSSSHLLCPNGITVDEHNNLFISNFSNNKIVKITPTGVASVFANTPGANNGHLNYYENNSTLYVCSIATSRIYSIDANGVVEVLAGSGVAGNNDGSAAEATFSKPNGIAISSTGDTIYINTSTHTTNIPNNPLNPSLIRMITNVQGLTTSIVEPDNDAFISSLTLIAKDQKLELKLQSQVKTELQINIFDIQGRSMITKPWSDIIRGENYMQLDISSLVKGNYLASFYSTIGLVKTLKFSKM